jgi:Ring finger domain
MSNNIYPSQLLNELHNWFPEILYNPGRFRTVQDLLEYIGQVADVNPYSRGLQVYRGRQTNTRVNNITTNTQRTHSFESIPMTARMRTVPVSNIASGPILSSLFGLFTDETHMLNQVFTPEVLQSFLNQTVAVYPSSDEIARATTTYTPTSRQADICTICQDNIEAQQQVRRIDYCNHYFHKDCVDQWFQRNVHCPTCRHDIREVDNTNSPPSVPPNHRRTNIRQADN